MPTVLYLNCIAQNLNRLRGMAQSLPRNGLSPRERIQRHNLLYTS